MNIEVKDLSCGYGAKVLLEGLNLILSRGEILCILGPNGVGKTTFFKTIQGFLKPITGEVYINNTLLSRLSRRELAQLIAYVPQVHGHPFSYSARDMVLMGRTPYLNTLSAPGKRDYAVCREVMEQLGIAHLADRCYSQLSGGEQQMVLIARAMAQEPTFLMMDEPTSNLDYGNQMHLLRQMSTLRDTGLGIMMITHSPDQAFFCADNVALFYRDRRVQAGATATVLTEDSLKEAYGITVDLFRNKNSAGEVVTTCSPVVR
jgi:iron complex transport system ATP-binding protein